ncbi:MULTISPECIES: alkaline phosphatase family protein [Natrialbaceae]|uniref:alkaline phosphatase family protein n=1 Tax=Natrialbaceae TaxID=1644061 RepID=UPI00207D4BAC|nr:nucleotide pyrophosphatase/phosphodiesterase family protein [Natronococcus sp. CG52]
MTDSINRSNANCGADSTDKSVSAGRVIVLDIVGLQPSHIDAERMPAVHSLFADTHLTDLRPPFPAVTVPCQTTLSTGQFPHEHGDISNGEYDREHDTAELWERDRADRTRIWEAASDEAGLTTGVLFFQHLIGTTADIAVTPSPIEDEDNNILEMNCWTNPEGFYTDLREKHEHFPLHSYWGPGANEESSKWILSAAREAIDQFDPDLLWVYVPHLDYAGQSDGPSSEAFNDELETVDGLLNEFFTYLSSTDRWNETAVNLVSEYGFHDVEQPVFPNRALREAGLLVTDEQGDVDLSRSDSFAMVDHQIAHVYADGSALEETRATIDGLEGIDSVLTESEKGEYGVNHQNAGEFVLIADETAWFQYYWWSDRENAPPYASDMDIHKKPGFDPCELFFGSDGLVSLDSTKVSGSHGRVDESAYGCYGLGGPAASAFEIDETVDATAVTPTIADLLGMSDTITLSCTGSSLFE